MPNWCNNVLEISHKDAEMMKRVKSSFVDGTMLNEFVPVPNNEWDYDWCIENWGTKWDISPVGDVHSNGDGVTLSFDSPWGPPIQAYEKLVEMGFTIRAYYYEGGMQFCGIWTKGIDEFYELNEYENADDVAASIPTVLDEMFCISESMREWEEENLDDEENVNNELEQ
jgi:hypothetical protein